MSPELPDNQPPAESRLETFLLDSAAPPRGPRHWWPRLLLALFLLLVVLCAWWSRQPPAPSLPALVAAQGAHATVPGVVSSAAVIATVQALLDKPGGFLANDALPPGLLLDDMPAFERGALRAVRDYLRALRRDFGRAESQFVEDPDLVRAESRLLFDSNSWVAAESEYRDGLAVLERYRARLVEVPVPGARFYPRADNLARWLDDVDARLGQYGQVLVIAAAGQTPWPDIDDNFFLARGYCWALRVQLEAAGHDFAPVLARHGGGPELAAALRALAGTQADIGSPVILNGSEYGLLANHSLVLAGHAARASVALKALRAKLVAPVAEPAPAPWLP